jgi:hypothetical protein
MPRGRERQGRDEGVGEAEETFWMPLSVGRGMLRAWVTEVVPAAWSPKIADSQTGRQDSEETRGWVTPLQAAAKLSAAAAYIDEVVWKAQGA